jgi:hypothetical protein
MMKVCDTGSTIQSLIPSSRVLTSETVPSLARGISAPPSGLMLPLPAITPTSKSARGSRLGRLVAAVPSCAAVGPSTTRNSRQSPATSTYSLPWLGGASITTRPSCGIGCAAR